MLKKDLIEADQVMSDKVNKTSYVYHRSDQKWYWLSNQNPDEVFIFPTWKAETEFEHAGLLELWLVTHRDLTTFREAYSPHGAAYLYQKSKMESPRESVQVRMIV